MPVYRKILKEMPTMPYSLPLFMNKSSGHGLGNSTVSKVQVKLNFSNHKILKLSHGASVLCQPYS